MSKIKGKYDLDLLYSIHDFYTGKLNQKDNNNNILIKYLKNRDSIENSEIFSSFIKELLNQIENNNTIILPFLEPTYDIIETYININNDFKDKKNFEKLLIKLIENSFFNKECLIPIYSYFTELYSEAETISESDDKIDKFKKITDLWTLIYLNCMNKLKIINSTSSFFLLGTGLEISFPSKMPEDIYLKIRINIENGDFLSYINQDDIFIRANNNAYNYSYKLLAQNTDNIKYINYIDIKYMKENSLGKLSVTYNKDGDGTATNLFNDNKIFILNNFYGQIKYIQVSFHKIINNKEITFPKVIKPYPLKDNYGIIFKSKYKFHKIVETDVPLINPYADNSNSQLISNIDSTIELQIKVQDTKLFKANYINYREEKFNMKEYLGGIIQFLPFLKIINGLYNNENIKNISGEIKNKVLINFSKNILLVIFKYFNNTTNEEQKKLDNYITFFLYLINKIEPFNSEKIEIDTNEFIPDKIFSLNNDNIYIQIIIAFLNYIKNKNDTNKKSLIDILMANENNENRKKEEYNTFNILGKTNQQLYRHFLKQLFVYNRLWSKQYLFFAKPNNCYEKYNKNKTKFPIKYKRLNYYTSNYQQPLIYPILEIEHYYPLFHKFNKNILYKNPKENPLNYDFSLDKNKNCLSDDIISSYLDKDINYNNAIKCCLIKKMYHIKGKILYLLDPKDHLNFSIFFIPDSDNKGETCNKTEKNVNEDMYNSDHCYGSMFPCLEKDKKRLIYIPSHKIVFTLKRIYFHKISGIEIFTSDNKSYYFNFNKEFIKQNNQENYQDNKLLHLLFSVSKPINYKNGILGCFNPKNKNIFLPFFTEDIDYMNSWDKMQLFSNFDKLMIINLFSNRSFHDLYQYPVFPMIYKEIGLERNMSLPIGFQEINDESSSRAKLIKESFEYEKDFMESENDTQENHYFNMFFSNIAYVCNYLIRVFPYSFISIEIQGGTFDTPDRLFCSIESTMKNSLSERADLRELIPEIYYFPPLFYNKNNLQLNKLSNGTEIDNVFIKNNKEVNNLDKYKFLKRMKNYLEEEQNLNKWIDLIFGINKEYNDKNERYYDKNNNVDFISKPEITNNDIMMQAYDFGVLPLQLFYYKFPEKKIIQEDLKNKINIYNIEQFNNDHIHCLTDEKISFICKGEKGINSEYLELFNKNNKSSWFNFWPFSKTSKIFDNIYYIFTGDVFGNLSIYEINKNQEIYSPNEYFEEISLEIPIIHNINNNQYLLIKKLSDHSKEIIYIDYNPRLNLLADFSLDGYINIYTMPTLKLVKVIQTNDFNIKSKIKKMALFSNPFPMVCCVDDTNNNTNFILFDINGEMIHNTYYNIGNYKIIFSVDKNLGVIEDAPFIIKEKSYQKMVLEFNINENI